MFYEFTIVLGIRLCMISKLGSMFEGIKTNKHRPYFCYEELKLVGRGNV